MGFELYGQAVHDNLLLHRFLEVLDGRVADWCRLLHFHQLLLGFDLQLGH